MVTSAFGMAVLVRFEPLWLARTLVVLLDIGRDIGVYSWDLADGVLDETAFLACISSDMDGVAAQRVLPDPVPNFRRQP